MKCYRNNNRMSSNNMKMVTNNSINTNSIIILSRYSYSPQYKVQLSIIIAIVKSHSTPLYSHPITSRYFSTMSTLWLLLCLHKRMSNNSSSSNSHRRHHHRSRSHHIPPNDNLLRRYRQLKYRNIRKSSNNNRSNSRRSSLMRSYRIRRLISLDKRMGRVNNNNKGRLRISSSLLV